MLITAADDGLVPAICGAAADAITFLAECGLSVNRPIEVRVVSSAADPPCDEALATYHRAADRINIHTPDICERRLPGGRMFRLPFDAMLYRSLVAHEIAHAVLFQQPGEQHRARAAQEYAAYVTQLHTLREPWRTRLLAEFRQGGFEEAAEISDLLWAMDPEVFAVKSYRHFLSPAGGCDFLRKLTSGGP